MTVGGDKKLPIEFAIVSVVSAPVKGTLRGLSQRFFQAATRQLRGQKIVSSERPRRAGWLLVNCVVNLVALTYLKPKSLDGNKISLRALGSSVLQNGGLLFPIVAKRSAGCETATERNEPRLATARLLIYPQVDMHSEKDSGCLLMITLKWPQCAAQARVAQVAGCLQRHSAQRRREARC